MALCMGMLSAWAVPAKRVAIEVRQPDGTMLTLTYGGDEFYSYLLTDDGAMVQRVGEAYYYLHIVGGEVLPSKQLAHSKELRSAEEARFVEALPSVPELRTVALAEEARSQRMRSTQAQRVAEVPTMGDVKVPVLLVQYSDVKFSNSDPKAIFEGHINGDDYKAEGGYGSVKEYFEDQSDGKFTPQFDVIGPVTLSHEMAYYGGNDKSGSDKNPRGMVSEACELADSKEKVNFSKYDNDGDGFVDIMYIIYAGYGEASYPDKLEDTVWPHQWTLAKPLELDGVNIYKYACNNELDGYRGSTIDGIGTFCHEFSHCLGLPDFYPTDGSNGFGMFCWSLMDYGCYSNNGHTPCGYTGYEKDCLGWQQLEELDAPATVELKAMSEGGVAYKIANDANPDEFYVVENHIKTKWDAYVAAEGMLVIHVDYKKSAWDNNSINNDPSHQRVTIIPADNKLTDSSVAGDTYPGTTNNTELTNYSTPAATTYKGGYMNKDITDITMKDGVVTFSFMKGALEVPVLSDAYDVTSSGFSVEWNAVEGVEAYEVSLDILEEDPYILAEDFNKFTKGNTDIGGDLDRYTIEPGWQGSNVFGLDGAIRIGSSSARGLLLSPYLKSAEGCFTMLFTLKKSVASDPNAGLVMGVIDEEWKDASGSYQLYGFEHLLTDNEWTTYIAFISKVGNYTSLYIDTRDYSKTSEIETSRLDFDAIYLFDGDVREELKSNAPLKIAQQEMAPMKVAEGVDFEQLKATRKSVMLKAPEKDYSNYKATNVFKTLTTDLNYRFEGLSGGIYRATLRSVSGGVYSRMSNAVDVEIDDSALPETTMAISGQMDNNILTLSVDDPEVEIYYTLDGTVPTSYGQRYEGPITLAEKVTMRLIGRKPGHRSSGIYEYNNWFEFYGATYRIESTVDPKVHVSSAMGGNSAVNYEGHFVVGDVVEVGDVQFAVVGIDDGAFSNATALRSVTIGSEALLTVGKGLFKGCISLNAVVWDIDFPLTADDFDTSNYNNLLVYLPAAMAFEHPLIESGHITLVLDGECDKLALNSQYPFYAPRAFAVGQVSLSRVFSQTTGYGSSAGWETIALPFDVQRIEHSDKGAIAPFGAVADRHFWLAQLSGKGFVATKEMRANVPYVIAMPNNLEYGNNTLNGQVTFSAKDVTLHATDELTAVTGNGYYLVPTYDKVPANTNIYALNIGTKHGSSAPGSVFAPGSYTVPPFSAYIVPVAGAQSAPYYRIQVQDDVVADAEFSLMVQQGVVIVTLPQARSIEVYDVAGRLVRTVAGQAGVNTIADLHDGLYLIEKTKVYVKH